MWHEFGQSKGKASTRTRLNARQSHRAEEESKKQISYMSEDVAEPVVHAMKHDKQGREPTTRIEGDRHYHNCGFQHSKGRCPAYGKRCMNCSKYNHFAEQAGQRKQQQMGQKASGTLNLSIVL